MRLGLISDTHDDQSRTLTALTRFQQEGVDAILHMGDTTSARTLRMLDGWRAWVARGNMDATPATLEGAARTMESDVDYGVKHELELGGLRVGVIHGDDWDRLEGMVNSGAFDVVLHGHTHTFRDDDVGGTRVINPGAVSHPRDPEPSVCVLDTATGELERITL